MQLINGKALALEVRTGIRAKVEERKARGHKAPHLSAILVGDDPASHTYVNNKIKACQEAGFESSLFLFDTSITQEELLAKIKEVNESEIIDGLIVQLPLPKHIDVPEVIFAIDPYKDVDGFHPVNVGRMAKGLNTFTPATPYGVLKILEHYKIDTTGKHCVVVGRSQIVGSPMSVLMARDAREGEPGNATVTLCHRYTENLEKYTREADILITAVGKPGFIKADMVKEGAVVIDVGTTRIEDSSRKSGFRLSGDVDFENVKEKCSFITPVPGGVGPMTIACLLLNTLLAVELHEKGA
ncbi:MAG: bifunctional 5,10-methylenetetrahydrofolate dehydrogenase/5,10-methenyltetrahydrofolate cyclohydrolase [Bacteroidota bacterium]|nr:bifunctional 5,10-methylenetetrahydrofolate dehydrogenase/5,10-methenyltetrahydrofolate cyclohydrolase [Bacteroidota bacterium]